MTTYDEVPYPTVARPQTHPDRLATHAHLFGLSSPDPDSARVLEIGCGDGGNLIPMAYAMPGAAFTGVDLAATAIAKGRELLGSLGLRNISLHHMDMTDLGPDFGNFDYILAHGVYSWVPADAQDVLLERIGSLLAPEGVAYVSYNTYPGGHLREMMREMMLYHIRKITGPEARVTAARAFAASFAGAAEPGTAGPPGLCEEAARVLARAPFELLHDELAEHHRHVYFHEFAAHARRHGLRYLAEADAQGLGDLPVMEGADRQEREQYKDFVICRRFRQSLLCRDGIGAADDIDAARVAGLRAAAEVREAPASGTPASPAGRKFRVSAHGHTAEVSTDHPVTAAALAELGERWPASVAVADLNTQIRRSVSPSVSEESAPVLNGLLLRLYVAGVLELNIAPHRYASRAGSRPAVSAVARAQARLHRRMANLRHAMVEITDDLTRSMILYLDGSHDRTEIRLRLETQTGVKADDAAIEKALQSLAASALLVPEDREQSARPSAA